MGVLLKKRVNSYKEEGNNRGEAVMIEEDIVGITTGMNRIVVVDTEETTREMNKGIAVISVSR